MAFTMRPATEADLDRLVEIYFSAFKDNAINVRVFPEASPQSRAFWRKNLADGLTEDFVHLQVVETAGDTTSGTASDSEAKKILAFAMWDAPLKATDPIPAMPPLSAWPSDGDVAAASEFFYDLERQHKRFMGPRQGAPAEEQQTPHWYLELIATHRDFQGRGAAGALLRYGEQQADAAGLPCYLDATPDGRPVYTSAGQGFREVDSRFYLGGEYEHVFMIRDPRPSSS
ncbi:hypothetical protein SCUCBS95973_009310 [Sporothrix curviconia]|uniref:N-acetyltransferase domain-containing protein n=1 Tax=Sporothrix curviconia TaxID=1260050 RepID=A0ABP0CW90_9PEZI